MNNQSSKGMVVIICVGVLSQFSSNASASKYEVEIEGIAQAYSFLYTGSTTFSGLPFYQYPRMGYFEGPGGEEGPGWQVSLNLEIDAHTGLPLDFTITLQEPVIYSFNNTSALMYSSGLRYLANDAFKTASNCVATNDFSSMDGFITIQCPSVVDVFQFGDIDAAGVQCLAEHPFSSMAPDFNLCEQWWAGGAANPPEAAVAATSYFSANASVDGVPIAIGPSPELFATTDYGQNIRSEQFADEGRLTGGSIFISHTGSPATGDLVITEVNWEQQSETSFSSPSGTDVITVTNEFSFVTPVSQTFVPSPNAKSVPAMGAFGIGTLLVGLLSTGFIVMGRKSKMS